MAEKAMNEALNTLTNLQEKDEQSGEDTEIIRNTIDSIQGDVRNLKTEDKSSSKMAEKAMNEALNTLTNSQEKDEQSGENTEIIRNTIDSLQGDFRNLKTEDKSLSKTAEEAMNEALNALATLQEKADQSSENVTKTIDSLQRDVRRLKSEDNKYIKGAQGVVNVAQGIVDNYDKFTSGDALEIASGAIAIIGTVGAVVGGPAGPLIAGVCGLIASILPLFGGKKGPSMSEVVDKVIREALDDFRDDEIYGQVIGSLKEMSAHIAEMNGVASYNSGLLSDAEKSWLTTMDFSTVGTKTLGVLQGQIEKYKSIGNEEKRSQRIAKYVYFYCMVSVQRTIIMNLQCSLLRANDMEGVFAGVSNYLYDVLPKEDRKVLEFVSTLPSSKDWFMVYRCLHTTLTTPQRGILSAYTKQIGCPPMRGKLCCFYNTYQHEYMYLPMDDLVYTEDRRQVFTWRRQTCDSQMLFRIIGDEKHCQIFGVYFGEYLYAADYAPYDSARRRVFSYTPGCPVSQGDWEISPPWIRNIRQNEYMYAADYAPYDEHRRRVFTWRPGDMVYQGTWSVREVSFEKDDLHKPFLMVMAV